MAGKLNRKKQKNVTRGMERRGFLPQLSRVINFVSGGEKKTSKRLEILVNAGRKFFDI